MQMLKLLELNELTEDEREKLNFLFEWEKENTGETLLKQKRAYSKKWHENF
jgi:hypothetical protein